MAVGADVLAVDQVAEFQVGQFLGQRDRVERVAGRAEDGADLRRPFLNALRWYWQWSKMTPEKV